MRELTSHKVNGLNEALRIRVMDEPGPGGANCHYNIHVYPQGTGVRVDPSKNVLDVHFQIGNPAEAVNCNASHEALLAILEDRLAAFQSGPFACIENGAALQHVLEAMKWLNKRTREREQRGVEGTLQK